MEVGTDADEQARIPGVGSGDGPEFADLVLPAATWGEEDFTRNNAERRLRLYGKIMDPPGESRPDWWAVSQVAQRMGFDGFAWADSNALFEESGPRASGRKDYSQLVEKALADGERAHEAGRRRPVGPARR